MSIVDMMAGMGLLNNMFNNGPKIPKHNYNKGDKITYELTGEDASWFGVDRVTFIGVITDIIDDYEYGIKNTDGTYTVISEKNIIKQ